MDDAGANQAVTSAIGARQPAPRGNRKARLHLRRAAAMCVPLLLISAAGIRAQGHPSEYDVKAAYLFAFGKFVQWPAAAAGPPKGRFAICVLGQDPFGAALDSIVAQGRIDGMTAVARRISKAEQITQCRVVFISSSEEKQLNQILASLDKAQILTVSDIAGFARRGGMIEFVLDGKNVRFDVNLAAARSAGLVLSSELLKVALNVRDGSRIGE